MENTIKLGQLTAHRPSSPVISAFLKGKFVIAGTGHRPDKLGGYGNSSTNMATGPIRGFRGSFGFLSNFAPCTIQFEGLAFTSVEAAYQAAKTTDLAERRRIQACATPGHAKALGKKVTLRPDWDSVKPDVMKGLLEQKFAQAPYTQQLLDTGSRELVEANTWGDTFWGVTNGVGENHLGKLLMEVRAQAAKKEPVHLDPGQVLIDLATDYLVRLQPDVVISGMALGWDMALAQAAVNLKVPLLTALPFPKQASRWPNTSQARHHALIASADLIVCVSSDDLADADIKAAMDWRNEFMVDQAHLILACFDGSAGGTKNCVDDATAQGKQIINTYPSWQERTATPTVKTTAPCRQVNHPEYGEGSVKSETTLRGEQALIVDFADQTAVILAASVKPISAEQTESHSVMHPKFGIGTQTRTHTIHGQAFADVIFTDQPRTVLSSTLHLA